MDLLNFIGEGPSQNFYQSHLFQQPCWAENPSFAPCVFFIRANPVVKKAVEQKATRHTLDSFFFDFFENKEAMKFLLAVVIFAGLVFEAPTAPLEAGKTLLRPILSVW